jgi:hypothetical protein
MPAADVIVRASGTQKQLCAGVSLNAALDTTKHGKIPDHRAMLAWIVIQEAEQAPRRSDRVRRSYRLRRLAGKTPSTDKEEFANVVVPHGSSI